MEGRKQRLTAREESVVERIEKCRKLVKQAMRLPAPLKGETEEQYAARCRRLELTPVVLVGQGTFKKRWP